MSEYTAQNSEAKKEIFHLIDLAFDSLIRAGDAIKEPNTKKEEYYLNHVRTYDLMAESLLLSHYRLDQNLVED